MIGVLSGCDNGPEERVIMRRGVQTALVSRSGEVRREVPITMLAKNTQNVVTTGVGLQLLATVMSPEYKGTTLQANDVIWKGDYVYASYNVAGERFLGAIQVINVAAVDAPWVVAEAIYPGTDINRIIASGDTVLAAGADALEGGTFERFALLKDDFEFLDYEVIGSYAGTCVNVDGNYAFVTYGDLEGGIAVFDMSSGAALMVDDIESFDARWAAGFMDKDVLVFSGSPGRLARYTDYGSPNRSVVDTVDVFGGNVGAPTWGQRQQDLLYLSSDEAGLLIYDIPTMEVIGQLPTSGTANGSAIANDRRLAFMANGEAGIVVADVGDPSAPVMLASLDVADDMGSANAVSLNGEYMALADGLGGVKIIRYDRVIEPPPSDCDGDGIPDDQDPDDDNDGALDEDDYAPCNPDVVCDEISVHFEAGFVGDFYNLPCDHPDMEAPVTGVVTGTLPSDFDWFDDQYFSFSLERESLIIKYSQNYFPVDEELCGDPFYFAVHWYTTAVASEAGDYVFEMGSDDDSWLFIDDELITDLGGIHAIRRKSTTVNLTEGPHRIDIYFAERHKKQSGLEFEMVSGPTETARLEFVQHLCLERNADEDHDGESNNDDFAPLDPPSTV